MIHYLWIRGSKLVGWLMAEELMTRFLKSDLDRHVVYIPNVVILPKMALNWKKSQRSNFISAGLYSKKKVTLQIHEHWNISSGELTYPTLGKGKSSSNVPFLRGYVSSLKGTLDLRGFANPKLTFDDFSGSQRNRIMKGPSNPVEGADKMDIFLLKKSAAFWISNSKPPFWDPIILKLSKNFQGFGQLLNP